MNHYDLTDEPYSIDPEYKKKIEESFAIVRKNVDKAELLVRALDLTDFELHVLARRLLDEEY